MVARFAVPVVGRTWQAFPVASVARMTMIANALFAVFFILYLVSHKSVEASSKKRKKI